MGQVGGPAPAAASRRREPEVSLGTAPESPLMSVLRRFLSLFRTDSQQAVSALAEAFELTGPDLYRLNCEACHGPDGAGAPPEIPSLLDPMRAAAAWALSERMEQIGRPIPTPMAEELAAQAEATLRERLTNGGTKMPPFKHLRGDEVNALLGYLGVLAGVPATARTTLLVPQSAARVGEHLMKGTCHVCHDATGPGGGHMAMMRGVIPSLATFPREEPLDAVLRQVEYRSSGMMTMMGGQSMPALPYITHEETIAGSFYLAYYPPEE